MKKILSVISLAIVFALHASAQNYTTTFNNLPRYAPTPYNRYVENTGRSLNYVYDSLPPDAPLYDTLYIHPNAFHTQVYMNTVTDSVALYIRDSVGVTNACYKGDEIEIQMLNTANNKIVKFAGPNVVTLTSTFDGGFGAIGLAASKRANIIFHFDGTKWVEVSRMVQQ